MQNLTASSHKLNDAPKHFEAFFEYATMAIVITDRVGVITAANPYALEEFGYKAGELVGQKIEILIPTRFHEKHSQHHVVYHDKPVSRKMGAGLDVVARKKSGEEIKVEISLSNFEVNGLKHVIAFVNNITARRIAEVKIEKLNNDLEIKVEQRTNELRKTLRELHRSRAELAEVILFQKAIVANAGAMIIATDIRGYIKTFNPEACRNLGYSEEEVIGKLTPMIFHDKSEIEKKRQKLFSEFKVYIDNDFDVMVENARRNISEEQQYRYIRKDGSTFPVSLTITAVRDEKKELIGYMGISFDISERIKMEEDLRRSLEKERELGELKSRFVSMASHEFRTPLSTILSSAYLIENYRETAGQPNRLKHLGRITSSVGLLTDILNDFLSLGKIEEGKIQVRPARTNIEHLFNGIVEEMQETLTKKQIFLYDHTGPKELVLDQSLFKHIVSNLVSNSSKFSPEKSLIKIKTINRNQQLVLSVKDKGIGIAEDDQKHLMERFFRGANAGNIQGTGLGLHIVAKYTSLMNGTVECKSELNKGTEFILTFNINPEKL